MRETVEDGWKRVKKEKKIRGDEIGQIEEGAASLRMELGKSFLPSCPA